MGGFCTLSFQDLQTNRHELDRPALKVTVLVGDSLVIQKRFDDEFGTDEHTSDDFTAALQKHNKVFNVQGLTDHVDYAVQFPRQVPPQEIV
jgi:hypothetical protein